MSEIVCEETIRGGDKRITYSDGTVAIEKENIRGGKEITYTKNYEEIARALVRDTAFGTQIIKTEYKDGESSTTIHNSHALLGPENITFRDGKTTNESCYSGIINHTDESERTNKPYYDDTNYDNIQEKDNFIKKEEENYKQENNTDEYYTDEYYTTDTKKTYGEIKDKQHITKEKLNKVINTECENELKLMIYQEKEYPEVQLEAINKLKTLDKRKGSMPNVIVFLFKKYDSRVRYEVFKDANDIPERGNFCNDCDYLVKYDPDSRIRLEAIKRMSIDSNQNLFEYILEKETNNEVRLEAIKKLTKEHMYEIVKNSRNEELSLLILNYIEDKETLEQIQSESIYMSVRKKAKEKLYPPKEKKKNEILKIIGATLEMILGAI